MATTQLLPSRPPLAWAPNPEAEGKARRAELVAGMEERRRVMRYRKIGGRNISNFIANGLAQNSGTRRFWRCQRKEAEGRARIKCGLSSGSNIR